MVPTGRFGIAIAVLASAMSGNVRVREKPWKPVLAYAILLRCG
jgi:hypothetical protein